MTSTLDPILDMRGGEEVLVLRTKTYVHTEKGEEDLPFSSHSSSPEPSLLGLRTCSIEKLSTVTGRGETGCFKLGLHLSVF